MTTETPIAENVLRIQEAADKLVHAARRQGVFVEIRLVPLQPLTQGNLKMEVHARPMLVAFCRNCKGSGEEMHHHHHGPEGYEEMGDCHVCQGSGLPA